VQDHLGGTYQISVLDIDNQVITITK
jgi:hypothetical protein